MNVRCLIAKVVMFIVPGFYGHCPRCGDYHVRTDTGI